MDTTTIAAISAGVVVLGAAAWWFFGSSTASTGPKSKEEIGRLLEAQGYRIKEIELDDGVYEVEAYKDGKEFEIKLDKTGNVLKIKEDD